MAFQGEELKLSSLHTANWRTALRTRISSAQCHLYGGLVK